ncbi:winged helix DNA-binding domain-containing protein [Symbioplanes lichenis]|uniref:winged helix DNA-binding domain-containing protein n=1 Tax=Symbioplanes lichenis TaxID=1629072 RepID=UPI002738D930|nr:winged helix DNA-binding domain-containing protein [Actinoplanes lichenis]
MRHVTDEERRARLAVRHALAPGHQVGTAEQVVRAMTVLHATEPATVHLSSWARGEGLTAADVSRALHEDRTVVKQLAMRRTLFVFPRDLLAAAWGGPAARVARTERAAIVKDVVKAGIDADGEAWLDRARKQMLDVLAGTPEGLTAAEVRQAVPMIDVKVAVTPGVSWTASRILTQLGASGEVMRGTNTGGWHTSRPRWTLTRHWLGADPEPAKADDGYREIVRRWLHTFGPGTEDDLVWWLGSTKTTVRTALTELDAVAVTLDGGRTGWLLPDDANEPGDPGDPGDWAALLPILDPTVMGWKERDWYLGPHREPLFDRSGNAGTTAWVNGRVVGCWVQDAAGVVEVRLLERVSARARRALDDEAARLTAWLAGFRVPSLYGSPAMRAH